MKLGLCFLIWVAMGLGQAPRFVDGDRKQKLVAVLPQVDGFFETYFKTRQTPGLVYGVVIDGELVHVKAMGVREMDSKGAVTADTGFRIASMTKSFTALAILKLRDAGKLSLDDPASKWVPELAGMKLPTRDSGPLTVRMLLTHGAGFPEDNPWGDRQLAIPDAEMGKWIDRGIPFSTAPDSSYEYSNYGFALLGRIVAKASGMSYEQYLEREILKPLGMSSTTLSPSKVAADRAAVGYGLRDGKYFVIPSLEHGSFGAMGGLVTTARDMAKYVAFHLAAEPARDEAESGPVKRSSVREMQRVWRTSNFSAALVEGGSVRGSSGGYGYGLGVSRDCKFSRIVSHGGGLPGFGSYMMWLPEYGVGMFAMANLTYAGPAGPMRQALDLMAGTGALKPRELPVSPVLASTRTALIGLWEGWSDAKMDALAADNLYLDVPRDRIAKTVAELRSQFSGCQAVGDLKPENWLRGTFSLGCQEGRVDVSFTLAPTNPPKVQYLQWSGVKNPVPALREKAMAEAKGTPFGQCLLGEVLSSNGTDAVSYRILCGSGDAAMRVSSARTTFGPAPGQACTP